MFGVVSLLVALAIVGMVVVKQLKAVGGVGASAAVPALAGSGTVREQSQQIQQQVQGEVAKALEQGAATRNEQAEK